MKTPKKRTGILALLAILAAPLCAQDDVKKPRGSTADEKTTPDAAAKKTADAPGDKSAAPVTDAAPAPSAEQKAVDAVDRAYEAAFEKGDAKSVADLMTEDAEFTSEEGRVVTGRAAIQEMSRAAFQSNKGSKLAINSESSRLLAPGVIVEKGTTEVTSKDGSTSGALYTAVLVQQDGKWKYSEIIETPRADTSPKEHLSELSWLVGDWQEVDKSAGVTVRSKFDWARGGNFLTRNVSVKRGEDVTLEGWQIIGWDPLESQIRSWTFDSEGGWSMGMWTRDGQAWLAREEGVTADGDRTTSDTTITKAGEDRLTWESFNRTLNGTPRPSLDKIQINRVKGN
jgi:uncharacterized protein (TIGR02246 family)